MQSTNSHYEGIANRIFLREEFSKRLIQIEMGFSGVGN
jgi:hypothetical protein